MIQIDRVLPKNLFNTLQLQQFQIGQIESKYANKIIKILKQLDTLPDDTFFLKRIRKCINENKNGILQVLLCLTKQKQQYLQIIQRKFQQEFQKQKIIKCIKTLKLPRYQPVSRKDFQIWTKYWPCTYLQPQFVKNINHSKQQLQLINEIWNNLNKNNQQIIDNNNIKQKQKEERQQNSLILMTSQQFLFKYQFSSICKINPCQNINPLSHPIMQLISFWPQSQRFKQSQNQFYYFTNLRLMIKSSHKICGMCAMALVHSRTERVYFQQSALPQDKIRQILYSLKLNHRINIFKLIKKY